MPDGFSLTITRSPDSEIATIEVMFEGKIVLQGEVNVADITPSAPIDLNQ